MRRIVLAPQLRGLERGRGRLAIRRTKSPQAQRGKGERDSILSILLSYTPVRGHHRLSAGAGARASGTGARPPCRRDRHPHAGAEVVGPQTRGRGRPALHARRGLADGRRRRAGGCARSAGRPTRLATTFPPRCSRHCGGFTAASRLPKATSRARSRCSAGRCVMPSRRTIPKRSASRTTSSDTATSRSATRRSSASTSPRPRRRCTPQATGAISRCCTRCPASCSRRADASKRRSPRFSRPSALPRRCRRRTCSASSRTIRQTSR